MRIDKCAEWAIDARALAISRPATKTAGTSPILTQAMDARIRQEFAVARRSSGASGVTDFCPINPKCLAKRPSSRLAYAVYIWTARVRDRGDGRQDHLKKTCDGRGQAGFHWVRAIWAFDEDA